MKKLILTFMLLQGLRPGQAEAQSLSSPQDYEITTLLSGTPGSIADPDSVTNPMVVFSVSDQPVYKVHCFLPDTLNVASVHVLLGAAASADLGTFDFVFDDPGQSGFIRDGNRLCLILGQHPYYPAVNSTIVLKDASGKASVPVTTTLNN